MRWFILGFFAAGLVLAALMNTACEMPRVVNAEPFEITPDKYSVLTSCLPLCTVEAKVSLAP